MFGPGGHAKWGLVTAGVVTLPAASVAVRAFYDLVQILKPTSSFMGSILYDLLGPIVTKVVLPAVGSTGILGGTDWVIKHADEKSFEGSTQSFDADSLFQS